MSIVHQYPLSTGFNTASTTSEVMSGIDLHGRTALVTGGYSGLGLETTNALAAAGAHVIVPARRGRIARSMLDHLPRVTVLDDVDLGDLHRVSQAADHLLAELDSIDLVFACAGVMATPRRPVGPGWDYQLAVNHFGHFMMLTRLYPLLARRGARVVAYSSAGHHLSDIRWHDLHLRAGYDKWVSYGQSKTANVLFAVALDEIGRGEGVRAFAVHPGKIITGLQRELSSAEQTTLGWTDASGNVVGHDFKTPSQGAATGLWAATSAALDDRGGLYLEDCTVAAPAEPDGEMDDGGVQPYAVDPVAAERLWTLTAAITACDVNPLRRQQNRP